MTQEEQDALELARILGGTAGPRRKPRVVSSQFEGLITLIMTRRVKRLQWLVLAGIPALYRASVWLELSGAHAKRGLHPPGYYDSLVDVGPSEGVRYAIAKDVRRTFPGQRTLSTKQGLDSLSRLLGAVAVHNPEIGYCQSLNFVAAVLLVLLPSEEDAFWVIDVIVNEILPQNYFASPMLGLRSDQGVLSQILKQRLPRISKALERSEV